MVGKIWEDKWKYKIFTYFVGDPLMQEFVSTFHSMVKVEQQSFGPQ